MSVLLMSAPPASAVTTWTEWTSATVSAPESASGALCGVAVSYSCEVDSTVLNGTLTANYSVRIVFDATNFPDICRNGRTLFHGILQTAPQPSSPHWPLISAPLSTDEILILVARESNIPKARTY